MAGLLLCLWGEQHESQEGACALEQVHRCSINKYVVEGACALEQVGIGALEEGKACGVVPSSLRLEEDHRKEVARGRRSLCAKA